VKTQSNSRCQVSGANARAITLKGGYGTFDDHMYNRSIEPLFLFGMLDSASPQNKAQPAKYNSAAFEYLIRSSSRALADLACGIECLSSSFALIAKDE
jgi:hypothetical protein